MSNQEDFEKFMRKSNTFGDIKWSAYYNEYTVRGVQLKWEGYQMRQPEIDALKAALSKSNANMERVERDLYLKINELEDEVERLKAEKRMWFDRHEALKETHGLCELALDSRDGNIDSLILENREMRDEITRLRNQIKGE